MDGGGDKWGEGGAVRRMASAQFGRQSFEQMRHHLAATIDKVDFRLGNGFRKIGVQLRRSFAKFPHIAEDENAPPA